MSKSNDKPKQDAAKRKKELPALAKAALFVLGVVIFTVLVLLFYKAQVDNFNAWSGLGFPVYDGAESVKTISIAVFAIFSLMAVLWRSIISASQVKELQEQGRRTEIQIENTEKQIQQADEKNLTELFTKGVELINTKKPKKNSALVLAGVSILHQVALKQNGLFKRQVEDILVNSFLENVTLDKNSPSYVWESLEAVNNINAFYNQTYICNSICLIKENIYFSNINGIEYKECNFYNVNFSNNVCYFRKCCFDKCTFLNTVVVFEFAQFNFCSLFNLAFASKDTNSYIQFFVLILRVLKNGLFQLTSHFTLLTANTTPRIRPLSH